MSYYSHMSYRDITPPIMENQMEKTTENEMETGIQLIRIRVM